MLSDEQSSEPRQRNSTEIEFSSIANEINDRSLDDEDMTIQNINQSKHQDDLNSGSNHYEETSEETNMSPRLQGKVSPELKSDSTDHQNCVSIIQAHGRDILHEIDSPTNSSEKSESQSQYIETKPVIQPITLEVQVKNPIVSHEVHATQQKGDSDEVLNTRAPDESFETAEIPVALKLSATNFDQFSSGRVENNGHLEITEHKLLSTQTEMINGPEVPENGSIEQLNNVDHETGEECAANRESAEKGISNNSEVSCKLENSISEFTESIGYVAENIDRLIQESQSTSERYR